ncbi:MAG: non-canonical purine NTP pyrophosphatase [archaeon]
MKLYFITGNKHKFDQVREILLPEIQVEQMNLDLDEIQEIDPNKVIAHKIEEAKKKHVGEFILEDVSLCIDSLNGLPGPLVKWFLKSLGAKGIYELTKKTGNMNAHARVIFGYFDGKRTHFFEGKIEGEISSPGKDDGFGWNPIFKPKGFDKVISEMTQTEKIAVGLRKQALDRLKEHLLATKESL